VNLANVGEGSRRISSGSLFIGESDPVTKSPSRRTGPRSRSKQVAAKLAVCPWVKSPRALATPRPMQGGCAGRQWPAAHRSGGLCPRESDLWDRKILIDSTILALERVQLGAIIMERVCLQVSQRHGPPAHRTRGLLQPGFGLLGRKRNHRRLPRASRYKRIGMPVCVRSQRKRVLLCGKSSRQRNMPALTDE